MNKPPCKICGSSDLTMIDHTARCGACGVLLYWPYPASDADLVSGKGKPFAGNLRQWYLNASFHNHTNFTNMLRFTMDESFKGRQLDILDYGGGAGQFALVCRSHYPDATVYVTDIDDSALMDAYRPLNQQIPFRRFEADETRFDVIFLNDVFEHVSDPVAVLRGLAAKIKPAGIIFIDTPRQFWAYPLTRLLYKPLYARLLRGTVSIAHLQVWSRRSFALVVKQAGLTMVKYRTINEYSMPPDHYLKLMDIRNPVLVSVALLFYRQMRRATRNKIICVLSPERG
jgi:2-polyprenyl-3-methyl-5-hydroxy-6-metoxy-1,4-benzoquinol methylase